MIDIKDRIRGDDARKLFALSLGTASDKPYDEAAKTYLQDDRTILYGYEKGTAILGMLGLRLEGKGNGRILGIGDLSVRIDVRQQGSGKIFLGVNQGRGKETGDLVIVTFRLR